MPALPAGASNLYPPGFNLVAGAAQSAAGAVSGGVGNLTRAASGVAGVADTAASAFDTVTNPRTWLRMAYGVAGVGLVLMAVAKIEQGAVVNSQAAQLVAGGAKAVATKGKA